MLSSKKLKRQYLKPKISQYSLNPKLNRNRFLNEADKFNLLAEDWLGEPAY